MAVKVNNTANIRKAKRWNENDDAALCLLLKKKIREVSLGMREASSPYERSHLKEVKNHYKDMLHKVQSGTYNGDIIFNEMQAAADLRANQRMQNAIYSTKAGAKNYLNSYNDMDFDYETAFRKKRYYGVSLPLFMLIMSLVIVAVFLAGLFLTPAMVSSAKTATTLDVDAIFTYKLTSEFDIEVPNDGNWPSGSYPENVKAPVQGTKYEDGVGNIPDTVLLYHDLGMTSINISVFDVVKAWFKTPMLKKVRLDFLEDNPKFQGTSFYYLCFMSGDKANAIKIERDADGNLDYSAIIRHIGVYGCIVFLLAAFVCAVLSIIMNVIRLFSYTNRRCHLLSILGFVFTLLAFICPALATIDGTALAPAFKNYFLSITNVANFLASTETTVGVGILYFVPIALFLLMMIFPKIFHNRLKTKPTFVPKGNKRRPILGSDPYVVNEDRLKNII